LLLLLPLWTRLLLGLLLVPSPFHSAAQDYSRASAARTARSQVGYPDTRKNLSYRAIGVQKPSQLLLRNKKVDFPFAIINNSKILIFQNQIFLLVFINLHKKFTCKRLSFKHKNKVNKLK